MGRAGHPSSYGLLGGARADRTRIAVAEAGSRFRESLAGGSDRVTWGLAADYESAVREVLANQPEGVLVTQAAHGEVGSSVWVFERLALLLSRVLMTGVPSDDAEVWKLVDRTWNGH